MFALDQIQILLSIAAVRDQQEMAKKAEQDALRSISENQSAFDKLTSIDGECERVEDQLLISSTKTL